MPRFVKGQSGNPAGRPKVRNDSARYDGWRSALTGIGHSSYDKRLSHSFLAETVDGDLAAELWRGDDLAARVIETVPSEMLRQGFDVRFEDAELSEVVSSRWEDLGFVDALWHALAYERGYGGGAVLLGAADGATDLAEPLDMGRVRSIDWMTALEPRELVPHAYYDNPQAPKYGQPALYKLSPMPQGRSTAGERDVLVHESRLIVFGGIRVSRRAMRSMEFGWGDSVLTRFYPTLRDFNTACSAAGILVADFAQAVFKMKGLAEVVAQDKDAVVAARMAAVELSRSVARAILIDAEEDFKRETTSLSGLPEMLDRFQVRLAAAADMPLTLLMGQSPAGLNATGESDIRFFYDRVKAMQERKLRKPIERVVKIILAALGEKEPESWSIHFHPLWQPTDAEQATARYTQAQSDAIYIANGVVSPEEIALARFGSDEYSFNTPIDFKARELLEPAAPQPIQIGAGDAPDADAMGDRLPDVEEAELVDRADRRTREG